MTKVLISGTPGVWTKLSTMPKHRPIWQQFSTRMSGHWADAKAQFIEKPVAQHAIIAHNTED